MAEKENAVEVQNTQPEEKKPGIGAKIKEWFRKQIVSLKRAPQRIPLLCLAACTIYFLMILFVLSQAVNETATDLKSTGICVFVATLLSILVIVSFLNSFPKRKKPNILFIVLVFVMIAAIVGCDVGYYVQIQGLIDGGNLPETSAGIISKGQPYILAHMVMLGVTAVVFALLPIYSKLINKINTSVKLESATESMQGDIDIQED